MSAVQPRLTSTEIRAVRFGRRWWRGLDPDEVYGFLSRLADEVDLPRQDVRVARADADQFEAASWSWRTRNARVTDGRWRGDRR